MFESIKTELEIGVKAGELSWGIATAITSLLHLEEKARADDATDEQRNERMLAERVLGGGADPASQAYLRDGKVGVMIDKAHRGGPGVYQLGHQGRIDYLALCSLSEDESQASTMRSRVLHYAKGLVCMGAVGTGGWSHSQLLRAAKGAEREYLDLRYALIELDGIDLRVYASDGGHAAGVWDKDRPQAANAVYGIFNGEGYVGLGAPPYAPPLEAQGFDPEGASKLKDDRFWIYEDQGVVGVCRQALLDRCVPVPKIEAVKA